MKNITRHAMPFFLAFLCMLLGFAANGQFIIKTIGGNGAYGASGDAGPATAAAIWSPTGLAVDRHGNVFITDVSNRIRKITTSGIIEAVAGVGSTVDSGDGGPASLAGIEMPQALAFDAVGNLYIGDPTGIRKMDTTGIISRFAGGVYSGIMGDGGPATDADVHPYGIAVDNRGNVYLTNGSRIRRVDTAGIITTIAGGDSTGYAGDGGPATAAILGINTMGIAVDLSGNVFFSDYNNSRIRKINTSGIISTVAGSGAPGYSGDGGAATAAALYLPFGLAIDAGNNLYISEYGNSVVRKVDTSGIITTFAGNGSFTYGGDGGAASAAALFNPEELKFDAAGNLYIADYNNNRVRKVYLSTPALVAAPDTLIFGCTLVSASSATMATAITGMYLSPASGTITVTAPGNFEVSRDGAAWGSSCTISYSGSSLSATEVYVRFDPSAVATFTGSIAIAGGGGSQVIYVSGMGCAACSSTPTAGIATAAPAYASSATPCSLSLGGYSAAAGITFQWQVATTGSSTYANISGATNPTYSFTGISASQCYRCIATCPVSGLSDTSAASCITYSSFSTCEIVNLVAGNNTAGYLGDGGAATSAALNQPFSAAVDGAGNIFVTDYSNHVIRKITPSGVISTIAGDGTYGFSGDSGPATAARISSPGGIAVAPSGDLYFADITANRIRKITPSGRISTIAGSSYTGAFTGDGGAATDAGLNDPYDVALDGSGNIYIADALNGRIRMINAAGIITTIAGNGAITLSGDGGMATDAAFAFPVAVAADGLGNVFVADNGNNRIRKIDAHGIITTYAGTSVPGFGGDGGPASLAEINSPNDLFVDSYNNLYIADGRNYRVRKITPDGIISTIAGTDRTYTTGTHGGDGGIATAATFGVIHGVTADVSHNVYIVDFNNNTIRKVSSGLYYVPPVTGPTFICTGTTITLADTAASGTWASASAAIATVSAAGIVTGVATGNDYISYTVTNACGVNVLTHLVTVSATAAVERITGPSSVCSGDSIALAELVTGGAWSVSSAAMATVSSTGTVGGVGAGTVIITYSLTTGCGVATTLDTITVIPIPVVSPVSGPDTICAGVLSTLTDTASGGYWSTSSSILGFASGTGSVFGYSAGSAPITYTLTTACGIAVTTATETVRPMPAAGAIAGATVVCYGATVALTDSVTGGVWSSGAVILATVSSSGVVSGVAGGIAIISYTVTSACGTASATDSLTVDAPVITATTSHPCGEAFTVYATGISGGTYGWSGAGLSCTACDTAIAHIFATTNYTVSATDGSGCHAVATTTLNANRIIGHISFAGPAPDTLDTKVWLIQYNPTDSSIVALDSMITCLDGATPYYEFAGLAGGNYMVKAKLIYGNPPGSSGYIPTYGLSSPYWDSGATVAHASASDSLHINMVYGTVPSGSGFISGYVYAGAGRGTSGELPVNGMLVYLRNVTDNVITYTYTNSAGLYSFGGLGDGSYDIYPTVFSYRTIPSATILLSSGSDTANNINFKQHTTLGIITPFNTTSVPVLTQSNLTIFPNPASGTLNIAMQEQIPGEAYIKITNTTGVEVYSNKWNIKTSSANFQVNVNGLANGVYFISIRSGSTLYTGKVIVNSQ